MQCRFCGQMLQPQAPPQAWGAPQGYGGYGGGYGGPPPMQQQQGYPPNPYGAPPPNPYAPQ
jgi:hypothetical protein